MIMFEYRASLASIEAIGVVLGGAVAVAVAVQLCLMAIGKAHLASV